MSHHTSLTTPAIGILVILLAVGIAFAGSAVADSADNESEFSTAAEAEAALSMMMSLEATDDGCWVVTVENDADASASAAVYADGTEYEDESEVSSHDDRRLEIDCPDEPDVRSIVYETVDSHYEHTLHWEAMSVECGDVEEEVTVLSAIEYEWSITVDGEAASDTRYVEFKVPEVACPELPEIDEEEHRQAIKAQLNESAQEHHAAIDNRSDEFRDVDPESWDGDVDSLIYEVGDEAIEHHDEVHEQARDAIRHGNQTAHDSYEDAMTTAEAAPEEVAGELDERIQQLADAVEYFDGVVNHVIDQTRLTIGEVHDAVVSLGERVADDVAAIADEHSPEPEKPDKPDVEEPDKPDVEEPEKPDVEEPEKPDVEEPEKPDVEEPEKPDVEEPEKPDVEVPEVPDEDELENEVYETGDAVIATHDELQELLREHIRDGNESAHEVWEELMALYESAYEDLESEGDERESQVDEFLSYVNDSATHVVEETEMTLEEAESAGHSLAERIIEDVSSESEAGEEFLGELGEEIPELEDTIAELGDTPSGEDIWASGEAGVESEGNATVSADDDGASLSGDANTEADISLDSEYLDAAGTISSGSELEGEFDW